MNFDYTWLIGGPQGSGVDTAANIFSNACALSGYYIFGKREYHSNIKGEHSYYEVRLSNTKINSTTNNINMLVGIDAETIIRHTQDVLDGGMIIFDQRILNIKITEIKTIDSYFNSRLRNYLQKKEKVFSIRGLLETAKDRNITLCPISLHDIQSHTSKINNNMIYSSRSFNIIYVSLSLGLLNISFSFILKTITKIFNKKSNVIKNTIQISKYAYDYAINYLPRIDVIMQQCAHANRMLIKGHESIALGKIIAGCRFQSYYPITPATDECLYMESKGFVNNNKPDEVTIIQSEDEISAICMAIGSSLTGVRSSTSTSGPGFSLMVESLGWAGINEVPIVITLYQRSGPSTGLPTRHGQEDLLFAIHAGHGEFPMIVYASGNIEESFYDTTICFNFSEIYQVPVIHMVDKFIASSIITCNKFDSDQIKIMRGKLLKEINNKHYKRFQITDDGISPRSTLGMINGIFWNTGDESDEYGHITEDPICRTEMMDKRISRLDLIVKTVPKSQQIILHKISKHCIISWGSTTGPILDAIKMLEKINIHVGFLQIKLLHPFPTEHIRSVLDDVTIIIDIEANKTRQLGKLFKQNLSRDIDYYILKYTGRPITCTEIYQSLQNIFSKKSNKEIVLTHGQ